MTSGAMPFWFLAGLAPQKEVILTGVTSCHYSWSTGPIDGSAP